MPQFPNSRNGIASVRAHSCFEPQLRPVKQVCRPTPPRVPLISKPQQLVSHSEDSTPLGIGHITVWIVSVVGCPNACANVAEELPWARNRGRTPYEQARTAGASAAVRPCNNVVGELPLEHDWCFDARRLNGSDELYGAVYDPSSRTISRPVRT